ncbi:MAG: hypothetical protein HOC23_20935 [Halieaceae bacterium]|jgi:hypothetical protein|nr:hypothetical protein [Halieaceae bacterium]
MGRANRRYYRTLILGMLAMATLVWAAVDQFEISPSDMLNLFLSVAVGVLGIIAAAGAVVVIWSLMRRLWREK